ncbi:hypothetical protein DX980_18320 [Burkholderia gladioli]|nr:hypothetical protein DX980_18320 [Burkholderia gladioli]
MAVIANWHNSLILILHETARTEKAFAEHLDKFFSELTEWDAQGTIDWATCSQSSRTPVGGFMMTN